ILSDIAALGVSLIATVLAQRPADNNATFGYSRVEVIAALANGLLLIAIAIFIFWEAIHRFLNPENIFGLPMLAVAGLGLVVNLLNITLLHPHTHNDLNLRGVFLHMLADTGSSIGILITAVAIHLWNWFWMDAAISLIVSIFISVSALPLIQESLKVLLEYAPSSVNPKEVEDALKVFPGVLKVEKLHIWTINSAKVMLCADLLVESETIEERDRLLQNLQIYLWQNYKINDSIFQLTNRKSKPKLPTHPLLNQSLVSMLTSSRESSQIEDRKSI
ncbi:MAG: cation transporter, partial [Calothrix sp. SM1_7_51]|nr:cation transporter [Calothrix sp. SM1_7_51]